MRRPLRNPDALWAAIDEQRLRTADLLDQLTENEWNHASLCDGWTVRDVAAHLTLQQMSFWTLLKVAAQNPGGLNTVINKASIRKSKQPKEQFASEIRAMVGSRRHNFGVNPRLALVDALVHPQDIAIPLGREMEMSAAAARLGADAVWALHGKGLASVFRNPPVQRMRLTATDVDWTVGDGPEIRGPVSALLLLLTGRVVALERLDGAGVGMLRGQQASGGYSAPSS